ncbi:MAG: hypothetical protein H6613_00055 [Ignavibacteriales bacterium]|nr:hypothetical protein [Ignavibacteriales bacterium]
MGHTSGHFYKKGKDAESPLSLEASADERERGDEGLELVLLYTINFNDKINTKMLECRHFEEFKFFYIRERDNHAKAIKDREWQLWNLHTNDFNIYAFDDLDTELLSIHDDWVYFRVFDELRRIALPDLESPEYQQKSELLFQDRDIVPNIHHVFWATEMPARVEWVLSRGR